LAENANCQLQRWKESQNPFINEFNVVYKHAVRRLDIFEQITNGVCIEAPNSMDFQKTYYSNSNEG
jgi:hypothetical protein